MMKLKLVLSGIFMLNSVFVLAQTATSPGMQTYSPYTASQLQEFNNQPLSPVEGPFGPVFPNAQEGELRKQVPRNSKFFSQPQGEEEAESLETESAEPYQPMKPVITF